MPVLQREGESSELPVAWAGTEELVAGEKALCLLHCLSAGDTIPKDPSLRTSQFNPSFFQHQRGAVICIL